MLAELDQDVAEARKHIKIALAAEAADAGENLLPLGDGVMNTVANWGTAGASQAAAMKANGAIKKAKSKEQDVCRHIQSYHPELASMITHGKSHLRLGQHKAIFRVNGWLDTFCDVAGCCSGPCDFTSWYVLWRLNGVRTGLEELQRNVQDLRQRIATGR